MSDLILEIEYEYWLC